MTVTFLATNLLESGTVTSSPTAGTAKPLSRLYDRDKALQYQPQSLWGFYDIAPLGLALKGFGQVDIDIDLAAATSVTAWALLNHNITGVTVTLYGDSFSPPTTTRDSFAATAADVLRTFATLSLRYWRIRIPAMTIPPAVGELFLGAATSLPEPEYGSEEEQRGNVRRDQSPAGYVWKTRPGAARYALTYLWPRLIDSDWTLLKAAFDASSQSAKAFPLLDNDGTVRWVEFVKDSLRRGRVFANQSDVRVELLDAL